MNVVFSNNLQYLINVSIVSSDPRGDVVENEDIYHMILI